MEKIKNIFKIHYVLIAIVIILIITGYFYICPDNKDEFIKFFVYLDNQTIAILIGAIVGLLIWFWQHRTELDDKYFAEYIAAVIAYLDLKQKEVDLRKAKNRRFWDFADKTEKGLTFENIDREKLKEKGLFQDPDYLQNNLLLEEIDKERIKMAGIIQTKIFLLRKLNNKEWEKINNDLNEFDKEYKEKYSKIPVVNENNPKDVTEIDAYRAEAKHIECHLEKTRSKIIENIKS